MKKLTLVSVMRRGQIYSAFVMADMIGGKAVVPHEVFDRLIEGLDLVRGETYTIG